MIDWTDNKSLISEHFSVGEALYLPEWKVFHQASATERAEIIAMAAKMELIRSFLGNKPINVNCWIRPISANCPGTPFMGRNYNFVVRGAPSSMHVVGGAVDMTVTAITCDEVRYLLEPELEKMGIRMERRPGSGWVHVDIGIVAPWGHRYFIP